MTEKVQKILQSHIVLSLFLASSLVNCRESVQLQSLRKTEQGEVKLAFGSCYGIFDYKGDIFKTIVQNDPSLWIWLGDAAYTDQVRKAGFTSDNSMPMDYIKHRFQQTLDDKHYQKLKETSQVIGVWDDHDYGCNDGDQTFSKKDLVRDVFLDFIGEPNNTARRLEKGTGIYQDYFYYQDGIKVHVILLDIRYHFDKKTKERLGFEQLKWLEKIFKQHSDANVTLIGMGVQALPDRFFITEAMNWKSKNDIFKLIRKHQKSGVVLLSGDVHFAQFYHTNCKSLTGYNLQELTSSGMTHHVNSFFKIAHHFLNYVTPRFWNSTEIYVNFNFALIKTKVTKENDVIVTLQVKSKDDKVVLEKVLSLKNDMNYDKENLRYSQMCEATHAKHKKSLQLNHYMYVIIQDRPRILYATLAVIIGLKSLIISVIIKFTGFVFRKLFKPKQKQFKKD
eukprot:403346407